MKEFDFNDLFILDLANNHQGNLRHALNIIKAAGAVVKKRGVKAALKFQFRQLDSFIHPAYKKRKDIKHIHRFMNTHLKRADFETLTKEVQQQGMLTMCTPFDEASVDVIIDMNLDIIKVASCSASDWPLLEKITETNRSVVISTAGLSVNQLDQLVSFLEHRRTNFALMHCVALYPTPVDKLNLNQIEFLKTRFPDAPIGFSTHEEPDNYAAIKIAYAKGARLFERHIGLETKKHKLNPYSSTPSQIDKWIQSYFVVVQACGGQQRSPATPEEIASLKSLMRGVFAKKPIKKLGVINRNDVFFAMPLLEDRLTSGEWHKGIIADKDYRRNEPLQASLANLEVLSQELIYQIMLQVKGMLNKARVFIGQESSVEISHHYGLERFREFGCVIVDCINRAYCKKLIIQLPRQKHPYHYHKKKEETFQLLDGDLEVEIEGTRFKLKPGDTVLIQPKQWHKFHTLDGAIFEEVSTTHFDDDSFYEDERIARIPREKRKTTIANWELAVTEKS